MNGVLYVSVFLGRLFYWSLPHVPRHTPILFPNRVLDVWIDALSVGYSCLFLDQARQCCQCIDSMVYFY
jgi:hypothetical protein